MCSKESIYKNVESGAIEQFAEKTELFNKMQTAITNKLENKQNDECLLVQLADCKRRMGDISEAAAIYDKLSTLKPDKDVYSYYRNALRGNLNSEQPISIKGPKASPIVECSNFLPLNSVHEILKYANKHKDKFSAAELIDSKTKSNIINTDIRNNTELNINEIPLFDIVRDRINEMTPDVYKRLGLKQLYPSNTEAALRVYHHEEFFRTHQDGYERKYSGVYFLNSTPKRFSGGDLVIFDTDISVPFFNHKFTRIRPKNNHLFFFPSNYYHAVLPVYCEDDNFLSGRFAINIHVG